MRRQGGGGRGGCARLRPMLPLLLAMLVVGGAEAVVRVQLQVSRGDHCWMHARMHAYDACRLVHKARKAACAPIRVWVICPMSGHSHHPPFLLTTLSPNTCQTQRREDTTEKKLLGVLQRIHAADKAAALAAEREEGGKDKAMLRVARPPPPDKEQSWLAQVGSGGILRGFLGGEREERRKDGKDSVGVFGPSEQVRMCVFCLLTDSIRPHLFSRVGTGVIRTLMVVYMHSICK